MGFISKTIKPILGPYKPINEDVMTNTREEVAVAKSIAEALFTTHGFASSQPMIEAAQSAIAASNSKYVAGLVEALKFYAYEQNYNRQKGSPDRFGNKSWSNPFVMNDAGHIARNALNNLPQELRQ